MFVFSALLVACGGDPSAVATASLVPASGSLRIAPIQFGEVDPSEIVVEFEGQEPAEGEDVESAEVQAEPEAIVESVASFVEDLGARWSDDGEAAIRREVAEVVAELQAPEASIEAPEVAVAPQALQPAVPSDLSVDQVIRRYASQTQYCHETAKERYSQVEGRVSVAWTVTDGQVTEVEILDDTTGDPRMAGCVARKVKYWRFPAGMDAEVEHPFVFQRAI